MITPSEFINSNIDAEKVEKIETGSKTSQTFKLCINGQLYFMKKLRPEYCNDPRYRRAFIKEYESGKSIIHPNIVKYTYINDDKRDIYILMEYVNGYTLKEKIENEPEYFQSNKRIEKLLLQLCQAIQTLHCPPDRGGSLEKIPESNGCRCNERRPRCPDPQRRPALFAPL